MLQFMAVEEFGNRHEGRRESLRQRGFFLIVEMRSYYNDGRF
jgi:hypothetical protein